MLLTNPFSCPFTDEIEDFQVYIDNLDLDFLENVAVASDVYLESFKRDAMNQRISIYNDEMLYFIRECSPSCYSALTSMVRPEEKIDSDDDTASVSSIESNSTHSSAFSNISIKEETTLTKSSRRPMCIRRRRSTVASTRTRESIMTSIRNSFNRSCSALNINETGKTKDQVEMNTLLDVSLLQKTVKNQRLAEMLSESKNEEEKLKKELEEAEERVSGLEKSLLSNSHFHACIKQMQELIIYNEQRIENSMKAKNNILSELTTTGKRLQKMRESKNNQAAKSWELELLISNKHEWSMVPFSGLNDLTQSQVKLEVEYSNLQSQLDKIIPYGCNRGKADDKGSSDEVDNMHIERAKAEAKLIGELSQQVQKLEDEKIGVSVAIRTLQQLVNDIGAKSLTQKSHLTALQSTLASLPKKLHDLAKKKAEECQDTTSNNFFPFKRKFGCKMMQRLSKRNNKKRIVFS